MLMDQHVNILLPLMLWHCWLSIMKSICPIKIEWWGISMSICLEQGANVWKWSGWCNFHLMTPLCLALLKSRNVLFLWCQLAQVVMEQKLLNGCLFLHYTYAFPLDGPEVLGVFGCSSVCECIHLCMRRWRNSSVSLLLTSSLPVNNWF